MESVNIIPELAEFIGIMVGDGNITDYRRRGDYCFSIAGNSNLDYEYLTNHVRPIIKKLFGKEPKFRQRKDQNTIYLYMRSKAVILYLEELGLNIGAKRGLKIPEFIRDDDKRMDAFLRGFVDTDGHISLKKRNKNNVDYPVMGLTSKDAEFMKEVANYLESKGFTFWFGRDSGVDKRTNKEYTKFRIDLSGRKNLKKWREEIGFSNPRNISKYENIKMGRG